MKKGTIVDSTLISLPSSTKNQEHRRDPEAHQVKKGNAWYLGCKARIGVNKNSGLVHTVKVTDAHVHDVTTTPKLLNGEEAVVYEDSGYPGAAKREGAVTQNHTGKKIRYQISRAHLRCRKACSFQGATQRQTRSAKTDRKTEYHVRFGERDILGVVSP